VFFKRDCLERLNLWPIHSHQKDPRHEGPKYLRDDVVWHFFPWEALPNSETNRYSWVEMASRCGRTGDDGERDTNCKRPANLEKAAKGRGAYWAEGIEGERGNCSNAREAMEIVSLLAYCIYLI